MVGHANWVKSAKFNSDGTMAVSGGDDKLVKLWDVAAHQCMHTFYDHTE